MTHEEWIKLTPDEQRIKVAELCGWVAHIDDFDKECVCVWWSNPLGNKAVAPGVGHLPDYLNDLNAMHEAESLFVQHDGCVWGDDWERYCKELSKICTLAEPANCLMRATAAQRAEAFVLTMY